MRFKEFLAEVAGGLWEWAHTDLGATAIAGALGGLVRWVTLRESVREGAAALLVGAVCAIYVAPLAVPILAPALGVLNLKPDQVDRLSPFLVGLGGVGTVGFIMDAMRARRSIGDDDAAAADGVGAGGGHVEK